MSVTPIDLSALDAIGGDGMLKETTGTPLMLDLTIVHEDPDQPRKAFDDILELAASIAEVGVKVPISVRPHPTLPGQYMVKFGARRRRAALARGLTHIPAWIDAVPSDFEQVIENLQRSNLTPMELADFIADKQAGGMKPAEIGRRLSISRSAVTKYLALANAPEEIGEVYRSGRSTSPDTLYDLRALLSQFPEEARTWLATNAEVSRRSVAELRNSLSAEQVPERRAASTTQVRKSTSRSADPMEIKRPVLAVKVGDRFGLIVLNLRAAADDHMLVKWDDTGQASEVPCRDIRVLRLDDARRYEPINRGLTATRDQTASPPAKPATPA